ncbi:MAG TPA: YbaK/EbsC family protein [Acidimicrobiales bacterium]
MPGTLQWTPALDRPDLLAPPVAAALAAGPPGAEAALVAEIDPDLADTAAFCEAYGVGLDVSANCVVVAAKRDGRRDLAACMVLATTRADVNGLVRTHLGAKKVSFASMDVAVAETGMAHGGITPVGLPAGWPLLVDAAVDATERVVVGSGTRGAKLLVPGALLGRLRGAEVLEGLGRPAA